MSDTSWMIWKPWPLPMFMRFSTRDGMNGLAREEPGWLDILAVDADEPGTGQFRRFIAACQESYQVIRIWEVWNPIVADALGRYGFSNCHATLGDLPPQDCWLWRGSMKRSAPG